jgi:hypothetical protein
MRGELVALHRAVGGEPVIGEGERAGEIRRTEPVDAVGADLECVAATGPERVGKTPIGAANFTVSREFCRSV